MRDISYTLPDFAAPPDDRRSLSTESRTPSPFGLASNASASSSPSPSSSSSSCSALETYSRKVFVGGLPPDIDQGQSNPPNSLPYYLGSLWYYQVTSSTENKVMFHSLTSHVFLFHADEIKEHFVRFGPLTVDWPHKAQSKAYFPPKGISQAITCCKVFLYFCS